MVKMLLFHVTLTVRYNGRAFKKGHKKTIM